MTGGKPMLLLDTNVWLDDAFEQRRGHDSARELIAYARAHDIDLVYAITTAKDVYYIAAQQIKAHIRATQGSLSEAYATAATDCAWDIAEGMDDIAAPIGMDVADVWMARKLRSVHNDLEDNLVIAAAERADADYIVTSDKQLLANPHVRALTAAQTLDHLAVFAR